MSVELFRDDNHGYAAWLDRNDQGYVINIQRTLNPADARMHHAWCPTVTGTPPRGRTWTGSYVKACSESLPELDDWALVHARSAITRCGTLPAPGRMICLVVKYQAEAADTLGRAMEPPIREAA